MNPEAGKVSDERLAELIVDAGNKVAGANFNGMPFMADEPRDIGIALRELQSLRTEVASLRRNAARYHVLRRSVLAAPMSAGFTMLTTESDLDAQCDYLIDYLIDASMARESK